MSMSPASTGIGQPVRRREDLRLLSGRGRYSDDTNVPGQAYAVMLRSTHAHARIRSVDVAAAMAAAGVLAVLTGRDMLADGSAADPTRGADRQSRGYSAREHRRIAAFHSSAFSARHR